MASVAKIWGMTFAVIVVLYLIVMISPFFNLNSLHSLQNNFAMPFMFFCQSPSCTAIHYISFGLITLICLALVALVVTGVIVLMSKIRIVFARREL